VLLTNLFLLGAVLFLAVANRRYLINAVVGPIEVDNRTLRKIEDPRQDLFYYVKVNTTGAEPVGEEVSRRVNKRTGRVERETKVATFLFVAVDSRVMLVKADNPDPGQQITGALVPMPDSVQRSILDPAQAEHPDLPNYMLPYLLDATGFRGPLYWGLATCLPLTCLSLWNVRKAMVRMADPYRHPIARALERLGPVEEVAAAISAEMEDESSTLTFKHGFLTPSWVIVRSTFGLQIVHCQEVLWVYLLLPDDPQTKDPSLCIRHHYGDVEASSTEERCRQLALALNQSAPWILVGYDAELDKTWKKNPTVIYHMVEQRRQQFLAEMEMANVSRESTGNGSPTES
jgi:hypothetical protein